MTETIGGQLQRTALYDSHVALGGRMVPFAGWEMPVEYSGLSDEHRAVRTRAGVFDVSHMGEVEIAGADALAAVQHVSCNDASRLQVGQTQYSGLTTPEGTFVDDLLVYRLAEDHFLLVVNAANRAKDVKWIRAAIDPSLDAAVVDASARYALIAVQGPEAPGVVQALTAVPLDEVKYYWFTTGEVAGVRALISRTGYTGEDGFELYVPPASAAAVWRAVLDAGRGVDLVPAGLGARDTLRLEAAMRLYGNDIDDTTTVLEADLGWIVGWKKTAFTGRDAIAAQKAAGVERILVGFELIDKGIARHGHDVYIDGRRAGVVTSGTRTPFLEKAIGLAYVPAGENEPGRDLMIDIRGRRVAGRIVPLPFYKRARS